MTTHRNQAAVLPFWLGKARRVAGHCFVAGALALGAGAQAEEPPLRTAVDGTFAPHAFAKLDGGLQGFNIDLAEAIGKRMNRKVAIDNANWSGLIPALNAGRYDFLIAVLSVNAERASNVLFTEGYLYTEWQFGIRKGSDPITRLEDLKGKVIAVNKGAPYHQWVVENGGKYGFTAQPFDTQPDAIQAVMNGRAYATLTGNTVLSYVASSNPMLVPDFSLKETRLPFALPFKRGNVEMRNKVEDALECLKVDGTLARLSEKWFGQPPAPDAQEVTVFPGYGVPGMDGYDPTPHELKCD